ncbi:MAG: hypothetical protein ABIT20_21710 [Gemmatimonadaceae bacterium]
MSPLSDTLSAIDRLRAQRDTLGQDMYALRTRIQRGTAALRASKQAGTRVGAPDPSKVATLREEIAGLEAGLRTAATAERAARVTIAKVDEGARQLEFLQKSLAGLQSTLAELGQQLQTELERKPIERKSVAAIQASSDRAKEQVADTQRSIDLATADQRGREQDAQRARLELRDIVQDTAAARRALDDKQAEIAALAGSTGPSPDEITRQLAELNRQYTGKKGEWKDVKTSLHDRIKGIYVDPHPRGAVAQMEDTTPFLLMPVRIETRFINQSRDGNGAAELLVRIYPDDVAVHTHENELTDREVSAGEDYWRAIFGIEKDADGDKGSRKSQTWRNFAPLFGPSRSAWVARDTRPANWIDLATIATVDDLAFPVHDLTSTASWSRAPRTNVLPDRFVIICYAGETIAHEVVGNVVPDELFLGPEPLDLVADEDQADVEDSFVTVDGQLTFGTNYDWASNFDRAVEAGMGVRIPLTATEASRGFSRILVLGVMASAASATGASFVEELMANHEHSPKGLTLLRQGTATNNTDGDVSGYSINDTLDHTQEVTGLDVPLFNENSTTDGRLLADALGVSYETLQYAFNADNTDYSDAVAMNAAMYPATLGYYFDTLLSPLVAEDGRARLRDFFVDNVTGRGPLAPIRIGDQPYGILLTSNFTAWKETPVVEKNDRFLAVLTSALKHFDAIWQAIVPQLMFAGKPGATTDDMLVNVLGLQPGSVTFAQRIAHTLEYLANLVDFQGLGAGFDDLIDASLRGQAVLGVLRGIAGLPGSGAGSEGAKRPLLMNLVFEPGTTALDAANLIDAVPLSESSAIRDFDPTTHKNYLHWLRETTSVTALSAQNFGGAPVPTALLYLQLRHSLILQLNKSAVLWLKGRGFDASVTQTSKTFYNVRPGGDLTPWEVLQAPVGLVDQANLHRSSMIADYLMEPSLSLDETAFLREMRDALGTLANKSTARLERCFTEHLDACTYRLDAWQTALFKSRLDSLRSAPVGKDGTRRLGTYLGAFGWVEDVKPSQSSIAVTDVPEKLLSPKGTPLREYQDNGGFIHAPSITQATAAAVLRAGYMSHATPTNPDILAVNLSSERVRRASFILSGMRNGQSLEALLGYQFERGIHDRASADISLAVLNALIFDIRVAFPIQRVRIAAGSGGGAEETVDSYDVINGVTLAETSSPNWATITGANAAVLTPARLAALDSERDKLSDTLDAVNDLLLSESAYQMVQGNFDRAGASLTSIKDAHIPPDLDVIKTPRSSRFTFTQRAAIHFARLDPLDAAAAAWPVPMTPRADTEPGVNQWLGTVLGTPANIVMTVFEVAADGSSVNPTVLSVADLALQPIDLVYIVGTDANSGDAGRTGASELETRVAWKYRTDNGLDETARIQIQFAAPKNQAGRATMSEVMPLMRALQTVLSDSRSLDAKDYYTSTTQGGTPSSGLDFADLHARTAALQTSFDQVVNAIDVLPFSASIETTTVTTLAQAFAAVAAQENTDFTEFTFTFAASDGLLLQQELTRLAGFGLADAFPRTMGVTTTESKIALVAQAMDAIAAAKARRAASGKSLADAITASATDVDKAIRLASDACKAILGQSFAIMPAFALANETDVMQSFGDHVQLVRHAVDTLGMETPEDEWIRSAAYVRPQLAAWERIRLLHETLFSTTLDLTAVQLPYRGQDSWLAVQFPALDPATGEPFDITRDTVSMLVHGDAAFVAGSLRTGILIDAWNETIPARDQSTGISFNYNRPNAMPPQALLLAIPPVMTGHWSWDALVGILNDTLRRAKTRAVEPLLLDQRAANPELGVLLPAIIAEFQQYALNFSLDLRLNLTALPLQAFYINPNLP